MGESTVLELEFNPNGWGCGCNRCDAEIPMIHTLDGLAAAQADAGWRMVAGKWCCRTCSAVFGAQPQVTSS